MGSLDVSRIMRTLGVTVSVVTLASVLAQEEVDPFEALAEVIPGEPGEDYPVFAFPPDTSFICDGHVQGYYADPEADCQTFHVCANLDGESLTKYSLLCPNGTLFNQQYFICDWWLNVDIAAEQAANNPEGVEGIGISTGNNIEELATSHLPSYPSSPPNPSANLGIQPRRNGKSSRGRK